jgi:hypothetical protein
MGKYSETEGMPFRDISKSVSSNNFVDAEVVLKNFLYIYTGVLARLQCLACIWRRKI